VVGDEDFRIWQVISLVPALTFRLGIRSNKTRLSACRIRGQRKVKSIVLAFVRDYPPTCAGVWQRYFVLAR